MQLHFMGGGARSVEAVGEYNRERTHFNHDICVNAKGYASFTSYQDCGERGTESAWQPVTSYWDLPFAIAEYLGNGK